MKDKKSVIKLVVGIAFMLVLVVGATYSYFDYTVNNYSTATNINTTIENEDFSGALTTQSSNNNLFLKIKLADMKNTASKKQNYYATTDSSVDSSTTDGVNYEFYKVNVTGGGNTANYYCEASVTLSAEDLPNEMVDSDGYIRLVTSSNMFFNDRLREINVPIARLKEEQTLTFKMSFAQTGNHGQNLYDSLSGTAYITNTDDDQLYLVGKSIDLQINVSKMSCREINESIAGITDNKDDILNGAEPVLGSGMIPVTIDNHGVVTYADTNDIWYNYDSTYSYYNDDIVIPAKTWANAVMLITSPSKTYQVGDIIKEEDIANYLVWIPRYEYKLFNVGTSSTVSAQEIEVNFGSIANMANKNGSAVGDWLTHPAFSSFNSNGFWVGKFELTNASSSAKIQTKPNVAPAGAKIVSTFFKNMKEYSPNNDSHMIKNTEWGAVAYLSYTEHGINGPIWINNNSPFLTGCSSTNASTSSTTRTCANAYGSGSSTYMGSTTGNISGVFDMSGGVYEYVAGFLVEYVPKLDGFSSLDTINDYDLKYFDKYSSTTRILGDATQETKGWNGDYAFFVSSKYPWFVRGGYAQAGSSDAGQFSCFYNNGDAYAVNGSRLVVTPAP